MFVFKFSTLLLLSHLISSCMTRGDGEKISADLTDIKLKIVHLEQGFDADKSALRTEGEKASQRVASTAVLADNVQGEVRLLRGQIDRLEYGVRFGKLPGENPDDESMLKSIARLQERISTLDLAVRDLSDKLDQSLKAMAVKPPAAKKRGTLKDLKGLKAAFEKEKYSVVADESPALLAKIGDPGEKAMARFYYAESLFKLGRTSDAALEFNPLLDDPKLGAKQDHVRIRMGDCFKNLGDKKVAKLYYDEVVKKYPQSPFLAEAQRSLDELGL